MKKLEDIPKKEIFNVPDGYFDSLPGKIQARISGKRPFEQPGFVLRYRLQYVIPVIAFFAIGIYWFSSEQNPGDAESILASVQTEELVSYLNNSELTTDDLLQNVEFNEQDIQDIESEVYELDFGTEDLDEVLGDFDSENI
jgi:hypothetical protein